MENYKVMQRLGKGAQGSVFLVHHLEDKENYVLKKVECNDETEANKAFKEAMALNELRHPYVCGYKEFFVTWDKEESAMFVCIVMEYYKMGDLDRVLKQRRKHRQPLEEIIIKKWLGQMVEALVFVHQKDVIHRDLKPSNIFLKEDLSISLGDFGVATIMGDKRTKTRTTVGSMNWMAPEVLERPYDERSDVWSLGCITLEMITCHILDATQMSGHLFELKNEPHILEDLLNRVCVGDVSSSDGDVSGSSATGVTGVSSAGDSDPGQRLYSVELCATIRVMLRRNFHQRPKAVDLVEFAYIQDCLRINASPLAKRAVVEGDDDNDVQVPNSSIESVLAFLVDSIDHESRVLKCLDELLRMNKTRRSFSVGAQGKLLLMRLMRQYVSSSADVAARCCALFGALLAEDDDPDATLYSAEMIRNVTTAMRAHPGAQNLQREACQLIMGLSADENACELIGRLGGIQDILGAMRSFHDSCNICAACCSALWSLTVNETNAKLVTEEKGISDVVHALRSHGPKTEAKAEDLVESACAALLSLSMEEDNIETMRKEKAMSLLVGSLATHITNALVVKNATLAMASLAEADEISALRVFKDPAPPAVDAAVNAVFSVVNRNVSGDGFDVGAERSFVSGVESAAFSAEDLELEEGSGRGLNKDDLPYPEVVRGVPVLLKAYEMHKENSEVVEGVCSLLLELAEYDDLRSSLHNYQLHLTLLPEALQRFADNAEVTGPAQAALDKIAVAD